MKIITHKKYCIISGLVGFFGTIAAITMDVPTAMSIATGTISPLKNFISIELALLYIFLTVIFFFKASHTEQNESGIRNAHVRHEYISFFARSLLSFIAGSAIGIFICFAYLIIGFRMINPHS